VLLLLCHDHTQWGNLVQPVASLYVGQPAGPRTADFAVAAMRQPIQNKLASASASASASSALSQVARDAGLTKGL